VISLIICTGLNQMCCGVDSSCCNKTGALIQVPVATEIYRPGAPAPNLIANSTAPSSSPAAGEGSQTPSTQTLAVGLGVGIPLGLALIAALFFIGWQKRKKNKAAVSALPTAPSQHTMNMSPTGTWTYQPSMASPLQGPGVSPLARHESSTTVQHPTLMHSPSELNHETIYDKASELPTEGHGKE
jgi:hypothetical protein